MVYDVTCTTVKSRYYNTKDEKASHVCEARCKQIRHSSEAPDLFDLDRYWIS